MIFLFATQQDVQLQMQGCKLRTLQAMRDKAAADVEKLWKKYEASNHPKDRDEFEKAQQGLKKIESQMKSFRQSSPNLQVLATTYLIACVSILCLPFGELTCAAKLNAKIRFKKLALEVLMKYMCHKLCKAAEI